MFPDFVQNHNNKMREEKTGIQSFSVFLCLVDLFF